MNQSQLILRAVECALGVDQRGQIQNPARAHRQVGDDAPTENLVIAAHATYLTQTVQHAKVSAQAEIPRSAGKVRRDAELELLRRLAVNRIQSAQRPLQSHQILLGQRQTNIHGAGDQGDAVKDTGQSTNEHILDFVAVEQFKKLGELFHSTGIPPVRASAPAPERGHFPQAAARE
jgi:hypothetical protein